jgi:hypothetical protein
LTTWLLRVVELVAQTSAVAVVLVVIVKPMD